MEVIIKENKIKLKKDYLTNAEVNFIVSESLKTYLSEEDNDIEGYKYNPLTMITNFYAMLFDLCIEDYNLDSIDDYNNYYNLGVHKELLKNITNAIEAYDLMISISKDFMSIGNIIDKNLQSFLDKIPEKEELSNVLKKLPKEWNKISREYKNITGDNTKNGD